MLTCKDLLGGWSAGLLSGGKGWEPASRVGLRVFWLTRKVVRVGGWWSRLGLGLRLLVSSPSRRLWDATGGTFLACGCF